MTGKRKFWTRREIVSKDRLEDVVLREEIMGSSYHICHDFANPSSLSFPSWVPVPQGELPSQKGKALKVAVQPILTQKHQALFSGCAGSRCNHPTAIWRSQYHWFHDGVTGFILQEFLGTWPWFDFGDFQGDFKSQVVAEDKEDGGRTLDGSDASPSQKPHQAVEVLVGVSGDLCAQELTLEKVTVSLVSDTL